jgi:hypothetical protein
MNATDRPHGRSVFRRLAFCAALMATALTAMIDTASAARTSGGYTKQQVRQMVMQEAAKSRSVPVSLAMAVARAESNFKADALSSAGARGVMQIMPKTGRDVFGVHPDQLWDPRLNIQLGIRYLESLIKRYRGHWDFALSHYNGGSRVGAYPNSRVIPATRNYVNTVLRFQRKYERDTTVTAIADASAHIKSSPSHADRRYFEQRMFDNPTVRKDWRHYLNVAAYWMKTPEERAREINARVAAADAAQPRPAPVSAAAPAPAPREWVAYSSDNAKPSHSLYRSIQNRRASFRRALRSGASPWPSSRGHLFRDRRFNG